MRLLGWVLLIVGVVFEGLFIMAELGGGNIQATAFFVAGMMIVMGWRLKSYGKGLVRQEPTLSTEDAITPVAQSPTTEIPLTPEAAAAIARLAAKSRRTIIIVIGCGVAFFLLLGEGIDLGVSSPSPNSLNPLHLMGAAALCFALIVGGIHYFTVERFVRKDLGDSSYLRTSGPVQVVSVFGGSLLRLTDRAFLTSGLPVRVLQNLDWATVDYSRHAHLIFEIRDKTGKQVYSTHHSRGVFPL